MLHKHNVAGWLLCAFSTIDDHRHKYSKPKGDPFTYSRRRCCCLLIKLYPRDMDAFTLQLPRSCKGNGFSHGPLLMTVKETSSPKSNPPHQLPLTTTTSNYSTASFTCDRESFRRPHVILQRIRLTLLVGTQSLTSDMVVPPLSTGK